LGVYQTDWFDKVLLSCFCKKINQNSNREIIERYTRYPEHNYMIAHFHRLVHTFQYKQVVGLCWCHASPQVLISNVVDFVSAYVKNKLIICIMNQFVTYLKEEHTNLMGPNRS
jgi:hypothetical protein